MKAVVVLCVVLNVVVVLLELPVDLLVLNVVVVLNTVVVTVLCWVLNVVVVLNVVNCNPEMVEVEVAVFLLVWCVMVNGPSREPPSFT